ncbi:MAG: hypothetical protein CVU84_10945 [Firmicutes bacterium HGW-Firmicutes-1]|jgi:hypothetical protein|nr:MAG: hypothetical protein CVU84_10945 [Firmicutes bacterium HGW-Firmicutes-1]
MSKTKIKRFSAILLIVFIVFIFGLSIYFAIVGNLGASLSALGFNAFFSVMLFFLLKFHRYVKADVGQGNDEE